MCDRVDFIQPNVYIFSPNKHVNIFRRGKTGHWAYKVDILYSAHIVLRRKAKIPTITVLATSVTQELRTHNTSKVTLAT